MEGIGLKVYLESLGFVSEDEEGNDSQNLRNTKRDYTDIQNALNKDHNLPHHHTWV
jgi:hypothetical protein